MLAHPLRGRGHCDQRRIVREHSVQQLGNALPGALGHTRRLNRITHIAGSNAVGQVRHVFQMTDRRIEIFTPAQMPFGIENTAEFAPVSEADAVFHTRQIR